MCGVIDQLPGLGMLAYIEQVSDKDKEDFIARMRADKILQSDGVTFDIYPASKKDVYQVATFLEPSEVSTTKTVYGFDFSSDPVRRAAFEKARDTNQLTATAPLQFVSNKKAGYVMMLPIYDPLLPVVTPDQRRAAYKGLVIISVRIKDVLDNSFSRLADENVLVQVYDGTLEENDLIYENISNYRNNGPVDTTLEELTVADRTLTVKYTSPKEIKNLPLIPSLWARMGVLIVTNLFTAYVVWARFRPKKI
jgi:CHASE1-domain containing sensor protein